GDRRSDHDRRGDEVGVGDVPGQGSAVRGPVEAALHLRVVTAPRRPLSRASRRHEPEPDEGDDGRRDMGLTHLPQYPRPQTRAPKTKGAARRPPSSPAPLLPYLFLPLPLLPFPLFFSSEPRSMRQIPCECVAAYRTRGHDAAVALQVG